ncbi:S-methyl-5-thioribose-1-phosphate isomerase [Halodesulfurarchaeum sp. HSR-GB]|uniref:S-methyl-5-thioribose-1-phosphate isomerase n=1 Tax=Halodesulfurarchaeum sp. HSR-GB TaxID=3074077 RepID=UPI00285DFA47|nr:S-methyl-5-thioribose-1-phosphate isomerase [Halodesulfurarchaeum sp. HSR-GB]MDR5657177.1 S-methyl-5-thioribose-1-phosphate isomerase [Halodesulfurarchaeum sp. HSR-GB]
MRTISWDEDCNCIEMVDQTKLPGEFTTYQAETVDELIESIQMLRVRGAPALGAAGAYGVALATRQHQLKQAESLLTAVKADAQRIASARPTAVNLERGVSKAFDEAQLGMTVEEVRETALSAAEDLADRDVERNKQIGDEGAKLLGDQDTVMTHCNAGALATVDWGTALGVVYSAREAGKEIDVVVNETRPLNQGSRISTVELMERDVPTTLIPDNASGLLMQEGEVDAVVVGADRVVLDGGDQFGDQGVVYNKVGTYKQAVLADRHDVPFIVAAPTSTVDANTSADRVKIEERDPVELREIYGSQNAPADVPVRNPAFDATPMELVDYLVTEDGAFEPPIELRDVAENRPRH